GLKVARHFKGHFGEADGQVDVDLFSIAARDVDPDKLGLPAGRRRSVRRLDGIEELHRLLGRDLALFQPFAVLLPFTLHDSSPPVAFPRGSPSARARSVSKRIEPLVVLS